ncbi:hypothetical protein SAMN04487948_103280 [Halogranum amylolyticum]|uniref:DUF8108 domain-containing protein n=1 Tax=Halogranum amylolyticum TaxID=660520 RepID=A0A1H8QRY0_9EURY|nr:hypothetical protein [Halogranum amylolyticum]SEO57020.1 hypothetical protein SAMN04487948_103280 [Halogranum amylolyticum]
MDRRALAVVGFVTLLFVGFLARGVLLSVGRIALVAFVLALLAGVALVATRQPAYRRSTVGPATRVLRRPLERDDRHRCAECDAVVDDGERRRFVREWVLFGVPILLLDDGENVYCSSCTGRTIDADEAVDATDSDADRLRER